MTFNLPVVSQQLSGSRKYSNRERKKSLIIWNFRKCSADRPPDLAVIQNQHVQSLLKHDKKCLLGICNLQLGGIYFLMIPYLHRSQNHLDYDKLCTSTYTYTVYTYKFRASNFLGIYKCTYIHVYNVYTVSVKLRFVQSQIPKSRTLLTYCLQINCQSYI